jgi:hypothetical protein
MKRLLLLLTAATVLFASLSGCIIVPEGHYHHEGYHN